MRRAQPPASTFPALTASIGQRIRTLRTQRGISLSALAASTRLGKGTLSELERGQRNPTLDTLFAIATTLTVPLSDLLEAPWAGGVVGVDSRAESRGAREYRGAREDGGASEGGRARAHGQNIDAELLGRWSEDSEFLEVYRMRISAGRRESRPHAPGVIESVTVVSGDVVVGSRGALARLSTGQSHTFRGDTEHVYEGLSAHSSTVLVMRYPLTPGES